MHRSCRGHRRSVSFMLDQCTLPSRHIQSYAAFSKPRRSWLALHMSIGRTANHAGAGSRDPWLSPKPHKQHSKPRRSWLALPVSDDAAPISLANHAGAGSRYQRSVRRTDISASHAVAGSRCPCKTDGAGVSASHAVAGSRRPRLIKPRSHYRQRLGHPPVFPNTTVALPTAM